MSLGAYGPRAAVVEDPLLGQCLLSALRTTFLEVGAHAVLLARVVAADMRWLPLAHGHKVEVLDGLDDVWRPRGACARRREAGTYRRVVWTHVSMMRGHTRACANPLHVDRGRVAGRGGLLYVRRHVSGAGAARQRLRAAE